ncbi:MARK3 [Symbiodinium natans]|uniref:MARK3 protein n=1 Tax=Symbiodinium natans TaxID=878477 RepID=A0A812TNQ6_9DINO|nr:MARK3 [Symbiodinium natans]
MRQKLDALARRFNQMLEGEQELELEWEAMGDSDDSSIALVSDPDEAVEQMTSGHALGFQPGRAFDTLPVYQVCFNLRRHPKTGIFHSLKQKLTIEMRQTPGAGESNQVVEVYVEMVGGNFRRDVVTEQECCLRLRFWTTDERPVFLSSVFWPGGGCMLDKNGMPVTIENGGYLSDPRRDTTIPDVGAVYDRVEEVELPDEVQQAWDQGQLYPGDVHQAWQDGCSSFELPVGSSPPMFQHNKFSLADDEVDEPLGCIVSMVISRWRGIRVAGILPNVARQLILSYLFFPLEPLSFSGSLAVAVGVNTTPGRIKLRDRKQGWEGECATCGGPAVSWLGGVECESCFSEH